MENKNQTNDIIEPQHIYIVWSLRFLYLQRNHHSKIAPQWMTTVHKLSNSSYLLHQM